MYKYTKPLAFLHKYAKTAVQIKCLWLKTSISPMRIFQNKNEHKLITNYFRFAPCPAPAHKGMKKALQAVAYKALQ